MLHIDSIDSSGRVDLNLIRVFVAIYETESATAAANQLNLTQPTVSYGLSKLRDLLSDRLFVRDRRSLRPTPRAEQLYPRFRDALAIISGAIEETQSFDPKSASRVFSIAMTDIGSMYFLPALESAFRERAPKVSIEIKQVPVIELVDQLASGKLDLAVGNLPSILGQTRSISIFHEHYVCLLGQDYADKIGSMTLKNFLASRHIAVSSTYSGHRLIEDALLNLGISRRIVIRTPYYTALPKLISGSDLVVLLPSRIAKIYSSEHSVVAMPAPMDLPEFDVRAHWHPRHDANLEIQWLREQVCSVGMSI